MVSHTNLVLTVNTNNSINNGSDLHLVYVKKHRQQFWVVSGFIFFFFQTNGCCLTRRTLPSNSVATVFHQLMVCADSSSSHTLWFSTARRVTKSRTGTQVPYDSFGSGNE